MRLSFSTPQQREKYSETYCYNHYFICPLALMQTQRYEEGEKMRKAKLIKHLQEMLRSEADKIYRLNCQVEDLENRLAQAEEKRKSST